MQDKVTYPLTNFNGLGMDKYFITYFTGCVITYACWKLVNVSKRILEYKIQVTNTLLPLAQT